MGGHDIIFFVIRVSVAIGRVPPRGGRNTVALFFLLVVSLIGSNARADRFERLIDILRTDRSYKVRLQAAATLGRLKDRRAVPFLITALRDERFAVRGVAAAALGEIGDPRAIDGLKRMLQRERKRFVKRQAQKAIERLEGFALLPEGTRVFLAVRGIRNESSVGGATLGRVLSSALAKEFGHSRGVIAKRNPKKISNKILRQRRVTAFYLDGSIVELRERRRGRNTEVRCSVRVVLSTYPGDSMKAFYTGGASMVVPTRDYSGANRRQILRELLEGAAKGAERDIANRYLRNY